MQFCSGESFDLVDPATGDVFRTIQLSTPDDVATAVETAAKAFQSWRTSAWAERAGILTRTATAVREDAAALIELLVQEQGKTRKEASIEVKRAAETFDFYAQDRFAPVATRRDLHGKEAVVVPLPLGVVAAIVPWNFPLTLLANKLVPALAAGNAVVVKPAQTTPLATQRLLEHLEEAGLPSGVVNVVLGEAAVGEALVAHPDVPLISFTGSTGTGRAIMASAAGRVKRLALELGGSDAIVVDADADVAQAAKSAAVGRFFNCGQACIAVKRAFVHADVYDEFIDILRTRVDKLTVGDGRTEGVFIGPQHTAVQRDHTLGLIRDAVDRGAKVLRGGGVPAHAPQGFFVEPTVLTDVPGDARIMSEECFGPVLPVAKVSSFDEGIARANESEFGLGSSVWSNNPEHVAQAVRELEAGYTWVNDMTTDYDALPFGGVKQSGFGKERGHESIDEYRNFKSVVAPAGQEGLS
jgi:acyl-CoA reductase-like NAD-dependent aldehyde dehydrogenase